MYDTFSSHSNNRCHYASISVQLSDVQTITADFTHNHWVILFVSPPEANLLAICDTELLPCPIPFLFSNLTIFFSPVVAFVLH